MGFLYHGSVYVGFASESDQMADIARGRLWAKTGLMHRSTASLFDHLIGECEKRL